MNYRNSISSPCDEAIGALPEPMTSSTPPSATVQQQQPPRDMFMRITNINSIFRLSVADNFNCDLESFAADPVGKVILFRRDKLVVRFTRFNGKCEIYRNGIVKGFGQKGSEEVHALGKKVVSDFIRLCNQEVGIFQHQIITVNFASELPWNVHLVKMKKFTSVTEFEPQIRAFAVVRYPDLGSTINLAASGKLTLICTGDCQTKDPSMPKAREALERLGRMASAFIDTNNAKTSSVSVSSPTKKHPPDFIPRRSDRIFDAMHHSSSDSNSADEKQDWTQTVIPNDLSESELRMFDFLKAAVKNRSPEDICTLLRGIDAIAGNSTDRIISTASLAKIGRIFGISKFLAQPVEPISEPPKPITPDQVFEKVVKIATVVKKSANPKKKVEKAKAEVPLPDFLAISHPGVFHRNVFNALDALSARIPDKDENAVTVYRYVESEEFES